MRPPKGHLGRKTSRAGDILDLIAIHREDGNLEGAYVLGKELRRHVPKGMIPQVEMMLGGIQLALDSADAACVHYRQALRLARSAGDSPTVVTVMIDMALAERARGRLEVAWALLWAARVGASRLGDGMLEGWACGLIGRMAHHDLGELEDAGRHYEEALSAFGRAGTTGMEATTLRWLAGLSMDLGSEEAALGLYREALDTAREAGDLGEVRRIEHELRELVDLGPRRAAA